MSGRIAAAFAMLRLREFALAPLPGTVNVTVAPLVPAPVLSATRTRRGSANAVPIVAICGVPESGLMLGGTTTPFVVRLPAAS